MLDEQVTEDQKQGFSTLDFISKEDIHRGIKEYSMSFAIFTNQELYLLEINNLMMSKKRKFSSL